MEAASGPPLPKERIMSRLVVHRLIVALALIAMLGAPLAAEAAPRRPAPSPLAWIWNLLTGTWLKEGCRIDPSGGCAPSAEAGCRIDPNGACASAPQSTTEAGCRIDPDGCAEGH